MPWFTFKPIWTPLNWLGIKLYKNITEDSLWLKVGNSKRKPLFARQVKKSEGTDQEPFN